MMKFHELATHVIRSLNNIQNIFGILKKNKNEKQKGMRLLQQQKGCGFSGKHVGGYSS